MSSFESFIRGKTSEGHWLRLGANRRFGICAPVFALRSERDCGVGDVGDLYALVDWMKRIGATLLQLLPMNDMGLDCMPYSSLSAFALDPIYLALDRIPAMASHSDLSSRLQKAAAQLNGRDRIDFSWVRWEKDQIMHELFRRTATEEVDRQLDEFRSQNQWLDEYTEFRALKEANGLKPWEEWDSSKTASGLEDRRRYFGWLQYWMDRQLTEWKSYASSAGVAVEGDIPILVARDSADVWKHPDLFLMDTSAGAPPDMYAEEGQNWGFPTYNWARLAETDYSWWRARLRQAQRYFDCYRIDHVVGFFRIWTIPLGEKNGLKGQFVPGDENTWGHHGYTILKMMLDSTTMLPLAEDLGTIPHVCRRVLQDMGICGLKVQRWEKWWEGNRKFIQNTDYPVLSVATLSTHDSETLADWWTQAGTEAQELWELMGHSGSAPKTMPPETQMELARWLAATPSAFVVHLLQDVLSPFGLLPGDPSDHRVNVPGEVSPRNWSWRCPVTLEQLNADSTLNRQVKQIHQRF